MKMKSLWIAVILLSIAVFASACFGEKADERSTQHRAEATKQTTEAIGDVICEDWPEETQTQTAPTAGVEQTEPEASTGTEQAKPEQDEQETVPAADELETPPTAGEEETLPTAGAEEEETPGDEMPEPGSLSYQEYLALSAAERQAYAESFPTMEEAMLWYEAAKKAYDESQDVIDISGGNIDLGDIMDDIGE